MLYVEQRIVDKVARLAFRPHTDRRYSGGEGLR